MSLTRDNVIDAYLAFARIADRCDVADSSKPAAALVAAMQASKRARDGVGEVVEKFPACAPIEAELVAEWLRWSREVTP